MTLAACGRLVRELHGTLSRLEAAARPLNLSPLAGREWHELLDRKLLPQLADDPYLVVAVVGGTNIGKSVVFNHLAGFRASASSPLASGTKHPVCVLPADFSQRHNLEEVFGSFQLVEWQNSEQALEDRAGDTLFWRTSERSPRNLLLLDTPDIDSDAPVNWQRADAVRQVADVLIAVLTQQKYNDAAVKQFFRKAAAEDKLVVIVFNQCELPDDEAYWPLWLKTFAGETGLSPHAVYVTPGDRKSAESLTLPFHERKWSLVDEKPIGEVVTAQHQTPFREVLSTLRFGEIRLQTLRGSLDCLLNPGSGAPAYLEEIAAHSQAFRSAADLLTAHRLAEVENWPTAPTPLLIGEIRRWWGEQRTGWSAKVHGFYDTVGGALLTPLASARNWWQGPPVDPVEEYRRREWDAVVRAVEKIYEKLTWLSELGNALLKSRLDGLLTGVSRSELLLSLEQEHRTHAFDAELKQIVGQELMAFREENPQSYQLFKRMDAAAAAARPGLTIVLALTGVGLPFGEAATHLASAAAVQAALHVVGDVAGGAAVAAGGELAVSQTASTATGYLQAWFHRLQDAFARKRAGWLATRLEERLLGGLSTEFHQAAGLPQADEYREAARLLRELRQTMQSLLRAS
ncbi:MAG TPA: GTPase domain-containing protein [Planctomycetaceae bacterium]|nr:GTPase domain-containing protein [Planctomycetaceae bacterium]